MNANNTLLSDHIESAEDVFSPPNIDAVGIGLMAGSAFIAGGFISIGVLVASFFSIGKFSIESGVSPMILAMTTFFSLLFGTSLYLFMAIKIFPNIYTRTRELYKHSMLYMVILYICMMPMYLMAPSASNTVAVLVAYLVHIMLAVFGLELILGIISQYRYVLLSFYANIAAMVISGGIIFTLFRASSASGSSLMILMGLSILAIFLSTTIIFVIKFLYYKYYTLTGNDPLGSLFYGIEVEEKQKVEAAQNTLLQ